MKCHRNIVFQWPWKQNRVAKCQIGEISKIKNKKNRRVLPEILMINKIFTDLVNTQMVWSMHGQTLKNLKLWHRRWDSKPNK